MYEHISLQNSYLFLETTVTLIVKIKLFRTISVNKSGQAKLWSDFFKNTCIRVNF